MGKSLVNVTYKDAFDKFGVFGFYIDSTYDDGTWAELLAFIQDLLDASQCEITKITSAREVPIASLTSNAATSTGSYDRIDDQAIIRWKSSAGELISVSIPAPVDAVFMTTGAYAGQDVDVTNALITALEATGETVPLLVTKAENPVSLLKGWRKGQKHS